MLLLSDNRSERNSAILNTDNMDTLGENCNINNFTNPTTLTRGGTMHHDRMESITTTLVPTLLQDEISQQTASRKQLVFSDEVVMKKSSKVNN